LKPHQKEVDKERTIRGLPTSQTIPDNQQLALWAQTNLSPQTTQQPAPQPTATITPYDQSQQQPQQTQLVPYNNNNAQALYSEADEDSAAFDELQQRFVVIAKAFGRYTNKSNNCIRSSSNTRNQDVVNNGRVEVQNRGYGRQMGGGQGFNAIGRINQGTPQQQRAQVV